jgi:hypothetical protein
VLVLTNFIALAICDDIVLSLYTTRLF